MTLSPEQFKKIALKEDIENLKKEMMTKEDGKKIFNAIDGLAKKFKDHDDEHKANLAAHDRIQGDVN